MLKDKFSRTTTGSFTHGDIGVLKNNKVPYKSPSGTKGSFADVKSKISTFRGANEPKKLYSVQTTQVMLPNNKQGSVKSGNNKVLHQ
jgi:hypothetical protein